MRIITESDARHYRAALMTRDGVPEARMSDDGSGFFVLQPGEQAVVPVIWENRGSQRVAHCCTHPDAPTGLRVLEGTCDATERMSVVVENSSELAVSVT